MSMPTAAQDLLPRWEVTALAEGLVEHSKQMEDLLLRVRPKEWIQDGAPQAFVSQHEELIQDIANLSLSAQNVHRNPEKLSAVVDTYLWLDRLDSMIGAQVSEPGSGGFADRREGSEHGSERRSEDLSATACHGQRGGDGNRSQRSPALPRRPDQPPPREQLRPPRTEGCQRADGPAPATAIRRRAGNRRGVHRAHRAYDTVKHKDPRDLTGRPGRLPMLHLR